MTTHRNHRMLPLLALGLLLTGSTGCLEMGLSSHADVAAFEAELCHGDTCVDLSGAADDDGDPLALTTESNKLRLNIRAADLGIGCATTRAKVRLTELEKTDGAATDRHFTLAPADSARCDTYRAAGTLEVPAGKLFLLEIWIFEEHLARTVQIASLPDHTVTLSAGELKAGQKFVELSGLVERDGKPQKDVAVALETLPAATASPTEPKTDAAGEFFALLELPDDKAEVLYIVPTIGERRFAPLRVTRAVEVTTIAWSNPPATYPRDGGVVEVSGQVLVDDAPKAGAEVTLSATAPGELMPPTTTTDEAGLFRADLFIAAPTDDTARKPVILEATAGGKTARVVLRPSEPEEPPATQPARLGACAAEPAHLLAPGVTIDVRCAVDLGDEEADAVQASFTANPVATFLPGTVGVGPDGMVATRLVVPDAGGADPERLFVTVTAGASSSYLLLDRRALAMDLELTTPATLPAAGELVELKVRLLDRTSLTPLPRLPVRFATLPADVELTATGCTTDAQGRCSVWMVAPDDTASVRVEATIDAVRTGKLLQR